MAKSVLVVDDSAIVRNIHSFMLKSEGFEVTEASNGYEAMEKLLESKFDLVVTDINMPKMNGIEFLEVIKKDENLKRIPVIILTTSKDDQDRLNTFNLSVAGYMVKPVDYLQFVEIVRSIKLYWTLSELPD